MTLYHQLSSYEFSAVRGLEKNHTSCSVQSHQLVIHGVSGSLGWAVCMSIIPTALVALD